MLTVIPTEAGVGDPVTLTATVSFTGEVGSKANIKVSFRLPTTRLSCNADCSSRTDGNGIAILNTVVLANTKDEKVRVTARADSSFDDLDRESKATEDEEVESTPPEPTLDARPIESGMGIAGAGLPPEVLRAPKPSTLLSKPPDGPYAVLQVIGMSATLPNGTESKNRELNLMLTHCPPDTVAANAFGEQFNAGPGKPPDPGEKKEMDFYLSCGQKEKTALDACGERDTTCRAKKLRKLGYDFDNCPHRALPTMSSSQPGQSSLTGSMRPFQYVRCVPKKALANGEANSDGATGDRWYANEGDEPKKTSGDETGATPSSIARKIDEKNLGHIFRDSPGHIRDTQANRDLLIKTASDEANYVGKDEFGNHWYSKILNTGEQAWASVHDDLIHNGGINKIPLNLKERIQLK